jgi:hypothetical protein
VTEPLTAPDIPAASMAQLKSELLDLKRSGVGRDQGQAYIEAWMEGFSRPSLAGSFAQGALGNYADEIKGGVRAMVGAGSGDRMTETARARGQLAASSQKNGWIATGAEVLGGVAPALLGGGLAAKAVAPAATGLGRLAQATAGGLAGGAATGAVYGSGGAVGGPGERLAGARNGAIVGGVVGGVAAPVVQGGQAVARKVGSAVTQRGAAAAAQRNFSQALMDAGTTPQAAAGRVAEAQAAGVPMTAAEGIGQSGQDLLDYAVNTPGAGRQMIKPVIEARQLAQPGRIKAAVSGMTGVDEGAASRALDAQAARSATAGPQYEAMNSVPAPQKVMEALWTQLKSEPEWQAAYDAAVASTRKYASVGEMPREMPPLAAFMKGQEALTAREVDTILQAVKDQVQMAKGILPGAQVVTGGPTGGRALDRTAKSIADMMSDTVPEFKAARQSYATASAYVDGLEKGQSALAPKVTIDEFGQMFKRATGEEKRGIREGLVSAYKAQLENFSAGPAADATKGMTKEAFGQKLRIALGDDTADRVMRQLEMENVTSRTANQIKNSATGFRGANKAAIEGEPLGQGGFSLGGLIQRGMGALDEATSQKMRGEIARTGMEMDPAQVERLLREAMARNPHLFSGTRSGALSGSAAALLTERGR